MRIVVHDFVGHAFPLDLSRELARQKHEVLHLHFAQFPGPKGSFDVDNGECLQPQIEGLQIPQAFSKYSYLGRYSAQRQYSRVLIRRILEFQPDVVLSGQTPTDVEARLVAACNRHGIRFVHWVQDFYSVALEAVFRKKFGAIAGKLLAWPFHWTERKTFRRSDVVVYITEDFDYYARTHSFDTRKSVVIENWAPLRELPAQLKENEWSVNNGLNKRFVFLYAGTMGLKHNADSLILLAQHFRDDPEVLIAVVSEGVGRDYLEQKSLALNIQNMRFFDFQPFARLPLVLGSGDVVLANLETDSSIFCVPSKVLAYMCSARPLIVSAPAQNLVVRLLERAGAGFHCNPGDTGEFLSAARKLYTDEELRARLGANARTYAERTFDISRICDDFLKVLKSDPPSQRVAV